MIEMCIRDRFLIGPMIDPSTGEILKTTLGHDLIHTIDLNVVPGTEKTDADGKDVYKRQPEESLYLL